MKFRFLALLLLAIALPCVSRAQAQWNGLAPVQTSQNPLSLHVSDGDLSSVLGKSTFLGTTFQLTPNATNYVYLDLTQNPPKLIANTTGFPTANIYQIAIAVTNATKIVTLTDSRPTFNTLLLGVSGGGSGTLGSVTCWLTNTLIGNCPDMTDTSGAPTITGPLTLVGTGGPYGQQMQEGNPASCLTPATGYDSICANQTTHELMLSNDGAAYAAIGSSSGTQCQPAVYPATGAAITSSTYFCDASTFSGVDPTGATDSYAGLQNAINAAIAASAELFIPAGSYKVSAGLVANSNYFRVRGAASYGNTVITASASGYTVFTIGAGSGQGGPQGYIKDITIDGHGRPTSSDGFAALLVSGMQEFEVTNVSLGGADMCLDYSNNSFGGYINNVRGGFGGTCNVGFNIRKAAGAGGDFTIVNMWMDGVIAGMEMGGNTGGYHFFGGQLNAGQGTSSPADSSGAVILGKDYLTGTTAESTVDFHGTSFEGTDYAWLFRTFWQSNLTCLACNLNPADGSHPAIGVYKGTNFLGGRIHLENCTISGFFSAASLASVAGVNGGFDGAYWTELNTYTAAQEPTIDGTPTYITSIAEQAGYANIATLIKSSTGLRVPDGFQEQPALATFEPTCNSNAEGTYYAFSDSTVSSPGAIISGGGSNHILGYCNGTNYVVGGTGVPTVTQTPPIPTNWVLVNTAKTDAGVTGVTSLAAPTVSHTAGNLLVACVESFVTSSPTAATTPTNTASDTWTLATSSRAQTSSGADTECWWTVTAGNASDVVTAHWGSTVTFPAIVVFQYSGNKPSGSVFDFGNNASCTASFGCSATASTPALGDLIIVVVNNVGGGAGVYTAQTGYLFQGFTGTNQALFTEVQPGALNVSQTPGFANAASSNYLISVAAFKTNSFTSN